MIKLFKKLAAYIPLLLITTTVLAQNNTVLNGNIVDDKTSAPLVGAVVKIKNTNTQTITDGKGNFTLTTKRAAPLQIVINFVGYDTKELTVDNPASVAITLHASDNQLSDVVISSGYTTQNKKLYSGAAAQVTATQLQNKPAQSFDQLLSGQAAGVNIVAPSNALNNTPVLRVRGINSITSGIYPLIVLDGVTLFTGSVGGAIGNNPLADINPSDIETINVLKDASATAIYGSRASNGVLVITTKKGKKGKAKVTYDGWASATTPYNLPKMLNATDYVTIKNEAMVNAGKAPGFALQKNADSSIVQTNWYDVAYHTGISQSHNVSISGATDATTYFFSAGYANQDGFIRNNTYNHKVARFNIDHRLLSNVTVGANISYSNSINAGPNSGAIPSNSTSLPTNNSQYIGTEPVARLTYILPPNVSVYNSTGGYNIQNGTSVGYGANISNPSNPGYVGVINAYNLQTIIDLDKNTSESNALIGNVFGEWEIIHHLNFRTSYGIDNLVVQNSSFLNPYNGDGAAYNGIATNTNSKYNRTDWANTLTYSNTFNKHQVKVLAGYEEIEKNISAWGAQETNLTDPYYTNYQGGFATITATGNALTQSGLVSYISNIDYNYDKKYLLSFNFRRDGLSALAPGNKYGNFGGGSVGWNIYEENFFQKSALAKFISFLKIRGSYGIVGNSEIGDYPAIGLYSSGTYNGQATLGFSQAGNSSLKWEKSTKTDAGLNISFINNRINVEFDYYKNLVDGLILASPQASSRGIPNNSIYANVGSLYNQGVELNINAHIINKGPVQWDANFNFSTLKNKVTALSNGTDIYTASNFGIQNMTRVGYSIGSIWAVPTLGINPANGQRIFLNASGKEVQYNQIGASKWTYLDGTTAPAIDNYLDGKVYGPSLPTYFGGFNNTITYNNFDLNIGITYSGGNKLYNGTRATISDQRYFNNGTFIKDRWTKAGQVTDIQKLVYGDNVSTGFTITNSALVEDGAYAKLKSVALGYNVPLGPQTRKTLSGLHLYVQATNLFTVTKYTGSDPEVSINGNSINGGKDQNIPPNARQYTFGVNASF